MPRNSCASPAKRRCFPSAPLAADPGMVDAFAEGTVPADLLALPTPSGARPPSTSGSAWPPSRRGPRASRSIRSFCESEEGPLEEVAAASGAVQEVVAARLVALRDAAWSLDAEFLGMLARARDLAGPGASPKLVREMRKVTSALESIDRIEVRGRDSAGILVMAVFPSAREADAFRASHAVP